MPCLKEEVLDLIVGDVAGEEGGVGVEAGLEVRALRLELPLLAGRGGGAQ